jgi:NAD(P)-dependent dehydrogenase (short-subunit alcohol dehydrogenase family)
LAGKIAVITGGNSGIGLATAKRFVEEGAYVVITGRREKDLKDAAAFIGRNVTTVAGDGSSPWGPLLKISSWSLINPKYLNGKIIPLPLNRKSLPLLEKN